MFVGQIAIVDASRLTPKAEKYQKSEGFSARQSRVRRHTHATETRVVTLQGGIKRANRSDSDHCRDDSLYTSSCTSMNLYQLSGNIREKGVSSQHANDAESNSRRRDDDRDDMQSALDDINCDVHAPFSSAIGDAERGVGENSSVLGVTGSIYRWGESYHTADSG
jgi:hypothetical protein